MALGHSQIVRPDHVHWLQTPIRKASRWHCLGVRRCVEIGEGVISTHTAAGLPFVQQSVCPDREGRPLAGLEGRCREDCEHGLAGGECKEQIDCGMHGGVLAATRWKE